MQVAARCGIISLRASDIVISIRRVINSIIQEERWEAASARNSRDSGSDKDKERLAGGGQGITCEIEWDEFWGGESICMFAAPRRTANHSFFLTTIYPRAIHIQPLTTLYTTRAHGFRRPEEDSYTL